MDRLSALPADVCMENILSRLTPRDLCRLAAAGSHTLRALAVSDEIWVRFLPLGYMAILGRATEQVHFATMKGLFYRIATRPLVLDMGDLIFSGDRDSGKTYYMTGARRLELVNSNGWFWIAPGDVSRFPQVIMLSNQGLLEFNCRLESRLLSKGTEYVAYLVFKIANEGYGFLSVPVIAGYSRTLENEDEDGHVDEHGSGDDDGDEDGDEDMVGVGDDDGDEDMVGVGDDDEDEYEDVDTISEEAWRFYLDVGEHVEPDVKIPHHRDGTWMEVELASFSIAHGDGRDVMIMVNGFDNPPMHGLIIEGIEVRPRIA